VDAVSKGVGVFSAVRHTTSNLLLCALMLHYWIINQGKHTLVQMSLKQNTAHITITKEDIVSKHATIVPHPPGLKHYIGTAGSEQ